MRAKGDFCEKITLDNDITYTSFRALKGRTDFVKGPNPAASNTRALSTTGNHLSSLRDEKMLVLPYIVCRGNTNAKLLHPGGMAACSRWLSPMGDTTGKQASASSILKGCQTCECDQQIISHFCHSGSISDIIAHPIQNFPMMNRGFC